jgi:hypothetical protein
LAPKDCWANKSNFHFEIIHLRTRFCDFEVEIFVNITCLDWPWNRERIILSGYRGEIDPQMLEIQYLMGGEGKHTWIFVFWNLPYGKLDLPPLFSYVHSACLVSKCSHLIVDSESISFELHPSHEIRQDTMIIIGWQKFWNFKNCHMANLIPRTHFLMMIRHIWCQNAANWKEILNLIFSLLKPGTEL